MHLDDTISNYKSAIVVLGGSCDRFKKRLEKGIELQKQQKEALLLIAGQNIHSNDDLMNMLSGNEDFIYENQSINTLDNAENAYMMLKAINKNQMDNSLYNSLQYNGGVRDVYIVTDTLHMIRAKRYFKRTFDTEFELHFNSIPEDQNDLPKKIIYELSGYLVSFLPRDYINKAKHIKNKYFKRI